MPTRFTRPVAPGRDSHESADTPEQALSTLAHPGKMGRRIILPRPTSRIMSVRSSACSVQGNGRRGAFHLLLFQVAGHRVLESLFGRPRHEQFIFPWRWGFYPVSEQRPHILIPLMFSLQGSALFSLVARHSVAGLAQRLRDSRLDRLNVFSLAILVRQSRGGHAFGLGAVSASVAVIAGIFELSPTAFHVSVAVIADILAVTVAVLYACGYVFFGSPVWSQVRLPFSCCGFVEILTWSSDPHEAEGLHPTWLLRR